MTFYLSQGQEGVDITTIHDIFKIIFSALPDIWKTETLGVQAGSSAQQRKALRLILHYNGATTFTSVVVESQAGESRTSCCFTSRRAGEGSSLREENRAQTYAQMTSSGNM